MFSAGNLSTYISVNVSCLNGSDSTKKWTSAANKGA